MQVLINIDVPDLKAAEAFYTRAFDLQVTRRFGGVLELSNGSTLIHLLEKAEGTDAAEDDPRFYGRHWTPVHLDIVVDDIEAALLRAIEAGARVEQDPVKRVWGHIAMLADPFGHGFCLIQFIGKGYDELT